MFVKQVINNTRTQQQHTSKHSPTIHWFAENQGKRTTALQFHSNTAGKFHIVFIIIIRFASRKKYTQNDTKKINKQINIYIYTGNVQK